MCGKMAGGLFKLLLFQMFVVWCGAMHVAFDVAGDVQDAFSEVLHTGKYSSQHLDPSQAEVVVPLKVTREGALLSHELEHAHEHSRGYGEHTRGRGEHSRTRRDVDEHVLHYNVTVGGRQLSLDLRPSSSFMTRSLVVERRHADGTRTRSAPAVEATACHYRGAVRHQPASSVALSACSGLAGLLRTEHGEYWIEPANRIPTEEEKLSGRKHVVYKRSAISDKPRMQWSIDPHPPKRNAQHYDKTNSNINTHPYDKRHHRRQSYDKRRVHNKAYLERIRLLKQQPNSRNAIPDRQNLKQSLQKNYTQRKTTKRPNEVRRLILNGTCTLRSEELESIEREKNFRYSKSKELKSKSNEKRRKGKGRKHRKGWRRKKKNCATKEPPRNKANYTQTHTQPFNRTSELWRNGTYRHLPHHHVLSHRADFPPSRRARSISRAHHVEVLLVADDTMVDFHREHLDIYLLTIMNTVHSLYLDHTIGNFIDVVVVKILVLESRDLSLNVSGNSDAILASFCRWQKHQNEGDDTHRHHHDTAIFITRQNLCGKNDASCSTLGVAHVAGMCQPERSCSVNEDNGLSLAHTITHELGHNFGLYHDTEKIGCLRRVGSTLHIMTPIFEADTQTVAWSKCSKRDVTNFLDAGMAECLLDEPSVSEEVYNKRPDPQEPAGTMFGAEDQCRLVWGVEVFEVCNGDEQSICEHLWCNVNNSCKTNLRGAASGTPCGNDMWCQNQTCVPRQEPAPPQDGGWGAWSEWSECSRTCGGGVSTQRRQCDSPLPANGGRFCMGERTRYKICSTEPCPSGGTSFRHMQCQKYGNDSVPSMDPDEPCELFCSKANDTFPGPSREFAADGTPCRTGTNDMCISGICRKVGCDWMLDSNSRLDACGVCNGDGVGCELVHGIYSKDTTKQSGYSEVAVIPAGSRNVKVEEIANSKNYIGIGSARSRRFYLNGRRHMTEAGEYLVAGTQAIYERDNDWEKIRIPGPIKEDIKIYQMLYREHRNPGVTYQYTIDVKPNSPQRHWWKISGWTECSKSCGGGVTRRMVDCIDERNNVTDPELCIAEPELNKPADVALHCNMAPCPRPRTTTTAPASWSRVTQSVPYTRGRGQEMRPAMSWVVGRWSQCSKTCYDHTGPRPVRRRGVYCVEKPYNRVMLDTQCEGMRKPASVQMCPGIPPCAKNGQQYARSHTRSNYN